MRLPLGVEIERLCLDEPRLASHVWLRSGSLEVFGREAAVRVPVAVSERDVEGPIAPDALRVARKSLQVGVLVDETTCTIPYVGTFLRPEDVRAPIKFHELRETRLRKRIRARVALDASLLGRVAGAIGASSAGVVLEVFGERDPILVRPNIAGTNIEAVVAPMIVNRPKRPKPEAS